MWPNEHCRARKGRREIATRYVPGTEIDTSVEAMQQAGLDIHYLQGTIQYLRIANAKGR